MIKNYQKSVCVGVCFLVFLCVGFFNISTNTASGLEVHYPTISGQTLTAETRLPDYVKYLFDVGMFLGFFAVFISLIIAGVMYFLSPVSVELKTNAKDRVSGAISGLLILVLTYLIITTINPQLSIFTFNELTPSPPFDVAQKYPGVYFSKNNVISFLDGSAQAHTSDVPDLGLLKNQVNTVCTLQNPATQTHYMSILYENINLWGKCQYIYEEGDIPCVAVDQFASSASVHAFDLDPNGDGVYFYRKSYFNDAGGYYKVNNSEIYNDGIYIRKLEYLKFQNVPLEEQDCTKYAANGDCTDRTPPSLGGKNISSVKIHGNYLVLFIYFGPNDSSVGPWTFCQEFPALDDANKSGPLQMKWQNILNNGGVLPNYVAIVPMQK